MTVGGNKCEKKKVCVLIKFRMYIEIVRKKELKKREKICETKIVNLNSKNKDCRRSYKVHKSELSLAGVLGVL